MDNGEEYSVSEYFEDSSDLEVLFNQLNIAGINAGEPQSITVSYGDIFQIIQCLHISGHHCVDRLSEEFDSISDDDKENARSIMNKKILIFLDILVFNSFKKFFIYLRIIKIT